MTMSLARRTRLAQALLIVLLAVTCAQAASPTSFCKCTCFTNSTLIQLTGRKQGDDQEEHTGNRLIKKGTCDDCNRKFCLKNDLPICKGAKETDVFTACFQRDSAKDQAVVFIFIAATTGLLVWAAIRPWVDKWRESRNSRQDYVPVNNEDPSRQ